MASYVWASDDIALFNRKVSMTGVVVGGFGCQDSQPRDLAWDGGHLWMVNPKGVMKKFTTEGTLVDSIVGLFDEGWGLTYGDGHLWASDPSSRMIYRVDPTSTGLTDSDLGSQVPREFMMHAPHPNPFQRLSSIAYELHGEAHVTLRIYDSTGRVVKTLEEGWREAGFHSVSWAGDDEAGTEVAGGVYFCRMVARPSGETHGYSVSRKLLLLR